MSDAPQIPDHTLLHVIGRGSYGDVWLARNVMGAGRAVKIVRRASFDSDRPFEREFAAVRRYEPASRMADGLVNVLHVGKAADGSMFYYVMELADAELSESGTWKARDLTDAAGSARSPSNFTDAYRPRTLRTVMESQRRLCPADCIAIAQSLVQALASLHRAGLTHRDIKPSNIIFVNGRAKLADIGLVGELGESRSIVGTEGYIPPEGPGLPGADLYALGMVLYEMVTGYSPAEYPKVPPEWMAQHAAVEMEFVEVVLHATEPQAARRYQSAGELQADLALLESGKSVRRVHLLERRWRTARRLAALAVAAVLVIGGGLWLWHSAQLREERADAAERLSVQARADERAQRFLALRERAARQVRSEIAGWRQPALRDIDEAAKLHPADVELRNTLVTALSRADLTETARWSQAGSESAGPVLSDDGSLVAVGQEDGSFVIQRTSDGSQVQHVRHWLVKIQPHFESAFTRDGRYFGVLFSGMRTLRPVVDKDFPYESWTWFRVSDGKIALELRAPAVRDAAPLLTASRFMAADPAGPALVTYDLDTGKETARVALPVKPVRMNTSPDGKLAALQTQDSDYCGELVVVETATGRETGRWNGLRYMSGAVAWMHDSRRLLLGGSDRPRGLRMVDTQHPGAAPERLILHSAEIVAVAVSPDDRFVLTSSWDQTSMLTDLVQRRMVAIMPGFGLIGSVGFSSDGKTAVRRVIEGNHRSDLLKCQFEEPLLKLYPVPGQVKGVAFSADGKWLAAGHESGLTITDLHSGKAAAVPGLPACGYCIFAGKDGQQFLVVAALEGVHVVTRDESAGQWQAGPALRIAGNNANGFSATSDGRVFIWGGSGMSYVLESGAMKEMLPGKEIVSGGASADGRLQVYSEGRGEALWLRDAGGKELVKLPAGYQPWVSISPDGARASANSLRDLRCWDTATRALLWKREKEFPFIRGSPQHTPDGRYLIARPGLHPALFDAATGEPVATLAPALTAPVSNGSTALTADGTLLSLPGRGCVLVWDLQALAAEMNRR